MLIDVTAIWTLNNFDNFIYYIFETELIKDHKSMMDDEDFMKIGVT